MSNTTQTDKVFGGLDDKAMNSLLIDTIENMSDGCQIIDFNYRNLYINKSLEKQSQTPRENFINKTLMEIYPGVESTRMFSILRKAMEERVSLRDESEFVFPNGVVTWFEVRVEPVEVGLIIFTIDITERKKREVQLENQNNELKEENKLQIQKSAAMERLLSDLENTKRRVEVEKVRDDAMLQSIGEGVFAVDKENKFILFNKKAEEILQIDGQELIGSEKKPNDIPLEYSNGSPIPFEDRPTAKALESGVVVQSNNYVVIRKDGTKIPISLTVTPIKIRDEIIGAIDVFRDITQEKRIDKAKTEFVSVASHQLRTPLGIVKWYLEALMGSDYIKKAPQTVKENLNEIVLSNDRLLELVKNLLTVSRIDAGKVNSGPELVDITIIVNEIISRVKKNFANKNINFSVVTDKNVSAMEVDKLNIMEVLENLLVNAVKYNKDDGSVFVAILQKSDDLIISIRDTGMGMDQDELGQIFTKFYRSPKAIKSNPEGSGLGLYIAKSYIEGWKGKLEVESQPNIGSTFTVTIPIKKQ